MNACKEFLGWAAMPNMLIFLLSQTLKRGFVFLISIVMVLLFVVCCLLFVVCCLLFVVLGMAANPTDKLFVLQKLF